MRLVAPGAIRIVAVRMTVVGLLTAAVGTAGAVSMAGAATSATPQSGARSLPKPRIALVADKRAVPPRVSAAAVTGLSRDLGVLSSFYGFNYARPTRLVLAASPSQFSDAVGPSSGDVLAAADEGNGTIIVSPASWRGDPARVGSVLMHEASHLVLGAKFSAAGAHPPRWLDEGMAQYVASDWEFDIDWAASQHQVMETAAASGRLVPIAKLDGLFGGDSADVQLAYAQSYSFVAYLASTYGQRNMRLFLDAAARPNTTLDTAAKSVFGISLSGLEAAWLGSVESRSRWWEVLLEGSNFITLLWTTLATLVIVGFVLVTVRKRRVFAEMEEGDETEGDERSWQ